MFADTTRTLIAAPARALAGTSRADRLGLVGLWIWAFLALLAPPAANLGIGLMALSLLLQARAVGPRLVREPLAWTVVASVALVLVAQQLAWTDGPASAADHAREASKLLKLWLFLLCAWHFAGEPWRIESTLALALGGFVLGRLVHPDMLRLPSPEFRPDYGLPALATAEYCALGILGLAMYARRWWRAGPAARLAGALAFALLTYWVVGTQGRAAWLTLALLLPACLALRSLLERRTPRTARGLVLGAALVTVAIGSLAQLEVVQRRIEIEASEVRLVLAGRWAETNPAGGVGSRAQMLVYGFERWKERPWLGWGPAAPRGLLSLHPNPTMRYHDLHNLYLDLAVRVGLLGAATFAAGLALVLRAGWRAMRSGRLGTDLGLVLLGGMALHLLLALTNMRALNPDWRHVWMLLAGGLTTFGLFAGGAGPRRASATAAPDHRGADAGPASPTTDAGP